MSTIHAMSGKQLPDADIVAVFEELVKRGYVKVNGAEVAYALPDALSYALPCASGQERFDTSVKMS